MLALLPVLDAVTTGKTGCSIVGVAGADDGAAGVDVKGPVGKDSWGLAVNINRIKFNYIIILCKIYVQAQRVICGITAGPPILFKATSRCCKAGSCCCCCCCCCCP